MAADSRPLSAWFAWQSLRATARALCRRIDLTVEGLDHLPREGPVMLASRHFHHFWDGCVLLATLPRPMRATVTLDWVDDPRLLRLMTAANAAAGWTVLPRADGASSLPASDRSRLLAASRLSVGALRNGELVLVFPEGYPNIDPNPTPKTRDDEMLAFRPGFLRFAALAERDGRTSVPIVPVGFEYQRGPQWRIAVRFGEPERPRPGDPGQLARLEADVRRLSGLPSTAASREDAP
ncbi:MAG: lysophospholipid acyltransferase family protein [Chloroflexota bacterium]